MMQSVLDQLTEREKEVLRLIGGKGLSYKGAAGEMENLTARSFPDGSRPKISWHTVRQYAQEIQAKIGSPLPPIRALTEFYYTHREELEA